MNGGGWFSVNGDRPSKCVRLLPVGCGRRPSRWCRIVFNRGMLSQAEISDRLEIQQLLVDYVTAIDTRCFDDLDAVFTRDAYIDYRAMGGIHGHYPQVKAWLSQVLPAFANYGHMLGLPAVTVAGDTATARTFCFNPMVFAGERPATMLLGLWYDDEFVRTADGWRMSRRAETKCFDAVRPNPG